MTPLEPPPGSPEAVALGCLCPVLDNAHGRGVVMKDYDSAGRVIRTTIAFWHNSACPLHGDNGRAAEVKVIER